LLKEPVRQEWVSYPEAERYSGLYHTTLWRYVTSGKLKAARVEDPSNAEGDIYSPLYKPPAGTPPNIR
jgi:hypothetical protein